MKITQNKLYCFTAQIFVSVIFNNIFYNVYVGVLQCLLLFVCLETFVLMSVNLFIIIHCQAQGVKN